MATTKIMDALLAEELARREETPFRQAMLQGALYVEQQHSAEACPKCKSDIAYSPRTAHGAARCFGCGYSTRAESSTVAEDVEKRLRQQVVADLQVGVSIPLIDVPTLLEEGKGGTCFNGVPCYISHWDHTTSSLVILFDDREATSRCDCHDCD